jgi:hypothetical protein
VLENPPLERNSGVENFPKTTVAIDHLLSQFPALWSDFAVVSVISCLAAIQMRQIERRREIRPIPFPDDKENCIHFW